MSGAVRELSPLPAGIRTLTDEEADRLRAEHDDLPVTPKHCLICGGTGSFLWLDGDEIAEWKCNCIDQYILHRYFLHAGIGLHYQRLSWADVRSDHPAIPVIREYIDNSDYYVRTGIGFLFYGPNGTGKTMFAVLLLKALLAQGHDGYFATLRSILTALTGTFRNDDKAEWFHRRIRNAGFLVIDEVGKEQARDKDWTADTLEDIVRHRVAHARPTILTTNYSLGQVEHYGPSLVSLLSERSKHYEFGGEDFRRTRLAGRQEFERENHLVRPVTVE